jgi:RNA ligase (TIGR02306 family)
MRKMVSIRRISSISSIPGADSIEVAHVDGWQVVVRKGEHLPGELIVFCEIDSLLPEREEFEFMRPRRFRVKTIKLRGQISQGLVFPLSILPLGCYVFDEKEDLGMDVSEALGIIKWEPNLPIHLAGHTKGTFPGWLPKTDEERIQNLGGALENLLVNENVEVYITEKLHGTSFTAYLRDGIFGVCSRNQEKKDEPGCTYWETAKKEKIEEKLRKLSEEVEIPNIACQGEMVGPGINKNTLGFKEHKIFMFNFFDIDNYEYFNWKEMLKTCRLFDLVPLLSIEELYADVDKWVNGVNGMPSTFDDKRQAEGIVVRCTKVKSSNRLSFKVINNNFLLKADRDA